MKTMLIMLLACVISQSFVLFTGGNSWDRSGGSVTDEGYSFTSLPASFDTYFYSGSATSFNLSIFLRTNRNVTCVVEFNGAITFTKLILLSKTVKQIPFDILTSIIGYNKITIRFTGSIPATTGFVDKFDLNGVFTDLAYVTDSSYYWGRRGSSCRLNMEISDSLVQFFYSEMIVPVGKDPIGSYFIANGFEQGQFGIQVNSATQRRVVFSVQSGYQETDPQQIPDQYTVILTKLGPEVERVGCKDLGSGGQSFLRFNWIAGQTYKFLIRAQFLVRDSTTYTAWFGDPTNATTDGWRLIASWIRPQIKSRLTGLYHSIEPLSNTYGNLTRMAEFKNQRYYDVITKTWKEVSQVTFNIDAKLKSDQRKDTDGGVQPTGPNGDSFFLSTNGFISSSATSGTQFTRTLVGDTFSLNDFTTLPF